MQIMLKPLSGDCLASCCLSLWRFLFCQRLPTLDEEDALVGGLDFDFSPARKGAEVNYINLRRGSSTSPPPRYELSARV